MAARWRIGCSSWTSEAWWGRVYPTGLAPGERLAAYARSFDAVEVDASYYRDPGAFLVRRWARATPEGFVFTMKAPRELLDPKKPVDREALAAFESHARELGPKLGALLLQFPPSATPNRSSAFLAELLDAVDPSLRYAVELRHAAWFEEAQLRLLLARLTEHRSALAWSYLTFVDVPPEVTTDLLYLRFIGDHTTVPAESHGELRVDRSEVTRRWAERARAASEHVENVFAFFNNHYAGFAPESVNLFRRELGLAPVDYGAAVREAAAGPGASQRRLD